MLSALAAGIFLPFVAAIGVWVAWNDMRFMKIPNKAVLALWIVWAFPGVLIVPMHLWLWGWGLAVILMVLGFVSNAAGLMGAGDAKFASAMAPFFVGGNLRLILGLMAACLLGAFATHRIARAFPAIRRIVPNWASWTHAKFPMGLGLSGMLIFYLLILIFR